MKIIFCGLILSFLFIGINAQIFEIKAKVDQRIELTSIVARLAEYDEYINDDLKIYSIDVDKYFAQYKKHPAVEFAKKIRESNHIGFDAVPSLAVHLNQNLTPKISFTDSAPDKRWGKKNAEEFTRLLQQFYKDTNCEGFFKSHAELYKLAEERFQTVVNKVDLTWYKNFYGELPKGTFNLYIGLLNGGMNFGPKVVHPGGKEELFAIIGTWQIDEKGLPIYNDDFLPTIIHEFNHSFINHLVEKNLSLFEPSGARLYQPIADKMRRRAYAEWKVMIMESLVRASVIRYLFEHNGISKANAEIISEKSNGFVWIDELFVLLGTYENNRKIYPTLRSFMPILVGYHADLVKRVEDKLAGFEALKPKVAAIEEFKNESADVSPNTKQITFVFDKPLRGKGVSINFGSLGNAGMPDVEKGIGFYNADATKYTLKVTLKPDHQYEFVMTGNSFISKDGYPLQEYVVKFKTKKE